MHSALKICTIDNVFAQFFDTKKLFVLMSSPKLAFLFWQKRIFDSQNNFLWIYLTRKLFYCTFFGNPTNACCFLFFESNQSCSIPVCLLLTQFHFPSFEFGSFFSVWLLHLITYWRHDGIFQFKMKFQQNFKINVKYLINISLIKRHLRYVILWKDWNANILRDF